jgi:uncharacterized membrane-anchored protein
MKIAVQYALALAAPFAALGWIVAREEWTRSQGREVRLEVRGYDPMDALSGRYLEVPLVISRLPLTELAAPSADIRNGDDVFVTLQPGDPFWTAASVSKTEPLGGVFLRGHTTWLQPGGMASVEYGLDRFYIPDQGSDPTRRGGGAPWNRHLTAVVRVADSGRASFVDLLVDGEPYATWNAKQPAAR